MDLLVTVSVILDTRLRPDGFVKRQKTLAPQNLGEPFMVSIPKEKSATGRHALFSLFVDARKVTATVNGRTLKGQPVPREFAGRQSSTAFLAYSETWIRL